MRCSMVPARRTILDAGAQRDHLRSGLAQGNTRFGERQVLEKAPQAQQAAGFGAATVPCPQTALRVRTPGCLGLALMGSYAKRSGDRVSDLDLVAFLANGAAAAYL